MIEVKKVRGENKLHPIRLSYSQVAYIESTGQRIEDFLNQYITAIAKKRKWSWFFKEKK